MNESIDYLIFKGLAGSHSYGTNIATSDIDYRGVFVSPPSYVLSFIKKIEQVESSIEDEVIFELKKFMNLCSQCNPNIIEILFLDEKSILYIDDHFKKLRDNRNIFLSKKIRDTFGGYAKSQMHRINGHKKWIQNPQPVDPPRLENYCKFIGTNGQIEKDANTINQLQSRCFLAETFGTTQFRVYTSPDFFKDKLGFFNESCNDVKYCNVSDDALSNKATYQGMLWVNFDEFKKQLKEWTQYWEWKKNRNPDRAVLEEKFSYDCKHALHLVRLTRMCEEILSTGEVHVFRKDAKELLDIRNGKFSYNELLSWADEMDLKLDELCKKSSLPKVCDSEKIDQLYREVLLSYWESKGLI